MRGARHALLQRQGAVAVDLNEVRNREQQYLPEQGTSGPFSARLPSGIMGKVIVITSRGNHEAEPYKQQAHPGNRV